jgi:dTDP-4-dehydrorhamnose reductase
MRILLLGANGQVGFELQRALAPLGELVVATRSGVLPGGASCQRADLADPVQLAALLDVTRPRLVVNAAAYTAVDRAEDEPGLAMRVNGEAVGELATWCARSDARLVHYSTDYVFDGSASRPYGEDAPTAPLGAYGRSKLAGEQRIRDSGARHMILRTAWVYGARGGNFLRTMLRLGAQREELGIVADQHGAPTTARLIAATTAALLARGGEANGTFHLSAAGGTTWHGFADEIFAAAVAAGLLARAPRLRALASDEYPTRARRPRYSRLDCTRLCAAFDLALPDWRAGLRDTIGELAEACAAPTPP